MKHALINPDQLCMSYDNPPVVLGAYVVEVEELEFPVAEPLFWADCSDSVVAYQFYWNNGQYSPVPIPPPPPIPTVFASYFPSPATAGQPITLSWTTTEANYVTFQSRGLTQYPANGSFSVTYGVAGTYDDQITAHGVGGTISRPISLTVV